MTTSTMAFLRVELQLLSPTCIAQHPAAPGQPSETLGYLSGTVLRGGIGTRWLAGRRSDQLDDSEGRTFQRLFLGGGIRFGIGWPLREEGRTRIVPLTAWAKKRVGGWLGDPGDVSGVRDVLPLLLQGDAAKAAEELDGWDRLGDEFALERRGRWSTLAVRRRLISRTALVEPGPIKRETRGVAAEGLLYSFEALEAGQRFAAVLAGSEDELRALRARAGLERDAELAIGQGRSRGMGRVLILNIDQEPAEERNPDQLAEQARAFSQRAEAVDGQIYLPVTLESDTLLRDSYLLPCASGDPFETLARYAPPLPPMPPGLILRQAIQRIGWIGGWDQIRQLPRAPQLVVRHGSVWVYQVAEDDLAAAIDWWLAAEHMGVGERRNEGYGRVRLLHPLHAEDRERW